MPRPPKTFGAFIGQRRVCRYEAALVAGARQSGEAVPSQLLIGPSGVGKSTLAAAIANERGSQLVTLLAGKETSAVEICDALLRLRDCDVLFIDEIHALNRAAQEIVSNAISTRQVPKRNDKGGLDRTAVDNLVSHFTLLAATTDPGLLAPALLGRFEHVALDAYTIDELKLIGQRVAEQSGIDITPQAVRRIAEVAQGSPRTVERRVEKLRLLFPHASRFTAEHVRVLLEHLDIDERGLTGLQRWYMVALMVASSMCRSLSSIAGVLGCDPAYVRREVEPHLVNMGFVEIEARGRLLTQKGASVVADCALLAKTNLASEPETEVDSDADDDAAPDAHDAEETS